MRRLKKLSIWLCIVIICTMMINYSFADDNTRQVFRRHDNSLMKIALTFDDGPHKTLTPEILDILAEYNIKATFFTVGTNVNAYPDIAERISREGHELGNHTNTHAYLTKYKNDVILHEILETERALCEASDCCPKLLRPPGGIIDNTVCELISTLDYEIILWSIDTRDWEHTPSETIVQNVLDNIDSGDIILMHDFISKNSPTPDALRKFIPKLLDEGYKFVTVSELLGSL